MKNKINQKIIFIFVKILVSLGAFGYIWYTFNKDAGLYTEVIFLLFNYVKIAGQSWPFWTVVLLMPVNLGFEVVKWQFLASKIEKISFLAALKGVLSGLTLGFVTPHSIGDYLARIYFMDSKNKTEAAGAVFVSRISQFYISIFYGMLGFFITTRFDTLNSAFFNNTTLTIFSLACLSSIFILFNFSLVERMLADRKWFGFLTPYVHVISTYSVNDFSIVFLLSLTRYLVFTVQYLILLYLFHVDIYNVLVVSAVWLVFLVKSIFPSFNFLNDLGVREASALFFLGNLGIKPGFVLMASLSLWIINILLPTLVGLTVIVFARFRKI